MPNFTVETVSLTKKFGDFYAVKEINLQIKPGELYALIGSNGAGKTTLMKMLVGLLQCTNGKVLICGDDIIKSPLMAKSFFGYVPDEPTAYNYLTGFEFLELTANLRQLSDELAKKRIKELINIFPIQDILNKQMSGYSRGNRQKVAFLASMISKPKILFIDEPIAGLDPESINIFGKTIHAYTKEGNTVLFISHNLSFTHDYSDRVGYMVKGKIIKEEKTALIETLEKFTGLS